MAWRRNDLPEAERLAQAALDAWRLQAMPYPFYWQALWPLIGVAVAQDRLADAVAYAPVSYTHLTESAPALCAVG